MTLRGRLNRISQVWIPPSKILLVVEPKPDLRLLCISVCHKKQIEAYYVCLRVVADKVAAGIGGALVAVGNGAVWRNPGKPLTDGLLAIFLLRLVVEAALREPQGPEFHRRYLVARKKWQVFFRDADVLQTKVPPKKRRKKFTFIG